MEDELRKRGLSEMRVTYIMRKKQALKYMRADLEAEKQLLQALEGIHIHEVIVLRNKKVMYIADLEQQIRNAEDEIRHEEGLGMEVQMAQ